MENNHFGTHEFMDLCEQAGSNPSSVATLAAHRAGNDEGVEYMTSDADSPMANLRRKNGREKPWKLHYFAVGNEIGVVAATCALSITPTFTSATTRSSKIIPATTSTGSCGASDDDYN